MNALWNSGQIELAPTPNRLGIGQRVVRRSISSSAYQLRYARNDADIHAAQSLRFRVFNLELSEGLEASYATLRDADVFDSVCTHLLVEERRSGEVVGTYRVQSGTVAQASFGFYSATEFDMTPFEGVMDRALELGRACIDRAHRNRSVLNLLWKGIAQLAQTIDARYLVGCSSINSRCAGTGIALYRHLQPHLAPAHFRTQPLHHLACNPTRTRGEGVGGNIGGSKCEIVVPKLLRAYLSLGAKICGPPAMDAEFGTVDFLTLMDLEELPEVTRHLLNINRDDT